MCSANRLWWLVLAVLACCGPARPAAGAEPLRAFEVVARGAQPITDGERTTGTAEAGEVLTVLVTDQDKYWVQSARGVRGWVDAAAVVRLADAESVYAQLIRAQPREPRHYERRARLWQQNGQLDKMLAD